MSKVKNCAIIGAGLGGLSLARLLPPSWNVVVFDKGLPPQTTPPHTPPPLNDRALGIWPAGWKVLQQALPSQSFLTLETLSTNLPPAAYRNSSGVWLSKAPEGAPERVFAVRESDIRSALSEGVNVRWESQVAGINNIGEGGVEIRVVGEKWKEESGGVFDLVVGADGASSIVRESIGVRNPYFVGTASASGWVMAEDVNALGLKDVPPFEVLSSGRRFAFVPAGGHGAASFFATIYLDEVVLIKNYNKKIETHFESVFSPIPEILQRSITPFRWDYHFRQPKPTYSSDKIALVGDAGNIQGPNLAQGGAVALEDSYVLAEVLKKEERGEMGLETALDVYQKKRKERAKRLNRVTKFTELLAHHFLDERRDVIEKVPQPLNGWVFRAALKYSLGPKIF